MLQKYKIQINVYVEKSENYKFFGFSAFTG